MRRKKTDVLGNLQNLLESLSAEISELKLDLKKMKAKMQKVFPSRRGRPPKNLLAALVAGGRKAKKAGGRKKKKAGRRGRPAKVMKRRGPGRPPKTAAKRRGRPPKVQAAAVKRGPGRPKKSAAVKTVKPRGAKRGRKPGPKRGPGRPPKSTKAPARKRNLLPAEGTKTE